MADPFDALEPGARGQGEHASLDVAANHIALSTAISLKRIADWLEGNGPAYLAEQITSAISAGMHHGFASSNRSQGR